MLQDWSSRYRVLEVHYDPHQLQALAQRMRAGGVNMVEINQTLPNLTAATSNLLELVQGRNLVAYQSDEIKRAVLNASVVEVPGRGYRLAKERPGAKIDLAAALSFACLAAVRSGAVDSFGAWAGYMADQRARYRPDGTVRPPDNPPPPALVDIHGAPGSYREIYDRERARLDRSGICAKCGGVLGPTKVQGWSGGPLCLPCAKKMGLMVA